MAAISVSATPQQLVPVSAPGTPGASNDGRFYLQNRGPAEVFIGPKADVSAATGLGLAAGMTLEYPQALWAYGYDLWLVTASGTADVRWVMI